jgi:hypothetical protein
MEFGDTLDLSLPKGYYWLIEQSLVGFEPFTTLQPWYYVKNNEMFFVNEKWPEHQRSHLLIAFARRQDNDDIACFILSDGDIDKVVLIHGWTATGYSEIKNYNSFWAWLKDVVDDIAEWVDDTSE